MTDENLEAALAAARAEGADEARVRARKSAAAFAAAFIVLLALLVGIGWTITVRAQEAAPLVIGEIATERQAAMEARIAERTAEAQLLAVEMFGFLQRLWEQNESLVRVRSNLEAATTEMRLLTNEVNAAFESPTRNLGTLLDNGPTRASAVLDAAVAIANELRELVPVVLGALKDAQTAASAKSGEPALQAILHAMDELLEPFLGTDTELRAQWTKLKGGMLAWTEHVWQDFDQARADIAGDELSAEFMRRLRLRVF